MRVFAIGDEHSLDAVVHGAQHPSMSDMRAPMADKISHRKETPLCAAR